jgi:hypothetical protein
MFTIPNHCSNKKGGNHLLKDNCHPSIKIDALLCFCPHTCQIGQVRLSKLAYQKKLDPARGQATPWIICKKKVFSRRSRKSLNPNPALTLGNIIRETPIRATHGPQDDLDCDVSYPVLWNTRPAEGIFLFSTNVATPRDWTLGRSSPAPWAPLPNWLIIQLVSHF